MGHGVLTRFHPIQTDNFVCPSKAGNGAEPSSHTCRLAFWAALAGGFLCIQPKGAFSQ